MGMTGAGMTAAVVASVESAFPGMSSEQITQLNTSMQAICDAIVTYIQGNAVVNPNTFAAPSGITVSTTGSATAQTGFTTETGPLQGTGTIS